MLGRAPDPSARVRRSDHPFRVVEQQESASLAQRSPPQRVVFPPYLYKLPNGRSQDFNVNNFSATLAAGVGQTVVPVRFALPGQMKGYVQIFGIYVLSPTNNTAISFSLRVNDAPVQGWDDVRNPPGVANFIVQNFADLQVEVGAAVELSVVATNLNAFGPWTVGAKIAGWYHSEADEQYYFGEL
jgi:hypothetical protein